MIGAVGDRSLSPAPNILIVSVPDSSDQRWASRLERALNRYRPPKDADVRYRRCGWVAVDTGRDDEIDDRTLSVIATCDFMVVVCSLRTPRSTRIAAIIRSFLAGHPLDRILPFMVEADPFGTFPPDYLALVTKSVRGSDGIDRVIVDQLAASVVVSGRRALRQSFRVEFLRLVAAILGASFDSLYDRERTRSRRRRRWATVAFAAIAGVVGLVSWRVSTTDAWVASTISNYWDRTGPGVADLRAEQRRIQYDELGGSRLLAHPPLGPGFSLWDSGASRRVWDSSVSRALEIKSSRFSLGVAEDQVSVVGVDLQTGRQIATPFRLAAPMRTFQARFSGTGAELVAHPTEGSGRAVVWSFTEEREIASFEDVIAPPGEPQGPMTEAARPDDLFMTEVMLTTDLARMVLPCRTRGRVATCLWNVKAGKLIAVLSTDARNMFGGFDLAEVAGFVATTEYRLGVGQLAFWRLDDGALMRATDLTPIEWGRSWPRVSGARSHLILDVPNIGVEGDSLLVNLASWQMGPLSIASAKMGVRNSGPPDVVSSDVAAWALSPNETAVQDLERESGLVTLKGLGLTSVEWFTLIPALHRLVVGGPNTLEIWDTRSGIRCGPSHQRDRQTSAKVTLDGRSVMLHRPDGRFSVIDAVTGEVAFTTPFVTGFFPRVHYNPTLRTVQLYTDSGEVLEYRWQKTNRVTRWVRSVLLDAQMWTR